MRLLSGGASVGRSAARRLASASPGNSHERTFSTKAASCANRLKSRRSSPKALVGNATAGVLAGRPVFFGPLTTTGPRFAQNDHQHNDAARDDHRNDRYGDHK